MRAWDECGSPQFLIERCLPLKPLPSWTLCQNLWSIQETTATVSTDSSHVGHDWEVSRPLQTFVLWILHRNSTEKRRTQSRTEENEGSVTFFRVLKIFISLSNWKWTWCYVLAILERQQRILLPFYGFNTFFQFFSFYSIIRLFSSTKNKAINHLKVQRSYKQHFGTWAWERQETGLGELNNVSLLAELFKYLSRTLAARGEDCC